MSISSKIMILLCGALVVGCTAMQEEREVTTSSAEAYVAYRDGLRQKYRGEISEARTYFEQAVEQDPEFGTAHMQLASVLRQLGENDLSTRHIERATELIPQLPEDEQLIIKIAKSELEFQIEESTEFAKELAEKYPEHVAAISFQAEQAFWNMDYDEATKHYDRLLTKDPDRIDIHGRLGSIAASKGDYESAIASFQRYVYFAPELPKPISNLGEIYNAAGRYDEAIQQFRLAIDKDPTYLSAAKNLAYSLTATGNIRTARSVLKKFEPVFQQRNQLPEKTVLEMNIAYETYDWENLLELAESAEISDEIDPAHINYPLQVLLFRTLGYLETGNGPAAETNAKRLNDYLERVRQRLPDGPVIRNRFMVLDAFLRSRFARHRGAPEESIELMETAIRDCGFDEHHLGEFRLELAESYFEAGRFDEAARTAQTALSVVPTSPKLNLVTFKSLLELGEQGEAVRYLRQYLEVMNKADEDHPDVRFARNVAMKLVPSE